nr:C1 family peptidase [bacterium]
TASDEIGPLADLLGRQALPTSFDWRSTGGRNYVNPIRDQGYCGSCYAFGAAASAEGSYNVANDLYGGSRAQFSEAFIAFCLDDHYSGFDGCDGSDYDYDELTALVAYGVCSLAAYPYPSSAYDYGISPPCPFGTYPATTRIQSWHRIPCNDIDAIKTAIYNYGPVDASVNAGTAFEGYSGGVYSDSATTCSASPCYYSTTNHVICLVGWVDTGPGTGYWILRNSWGTSWGESGYMRISYYAARVACEACYLVSSGGGSSGDNPILAGGDYNGDGRSDIAVFRPSTGQWLIRGRTKFYFGQTGDVAAPGDYDGDGTTNPGLFRGSAGKWLYRDGATIYQVYYGQDGDIPAPGYWHGNTDDCWVALFRPSNGKWFVYGITQFFYGNSSDIPVPGDYNGNGTTDPAVFRSTGQWLVRNRTRFYYGASGDTPVVADFWYGGADNPGIFRSSTGQWQIRGYTRAYYGTDGDVPVPANYGTIAARKDDIAVFRPSSGQWLAKGVTRAYYGSNGDVPVTR